MIGLLLAGLVQAAEIVPWAAPWGIQEQYDAHRKAKGLEPEALACEPLWAETARLCFQEFEGGKRRRLPQREATDGLRATATAQAAAWIATELEEVPIGGMEARYLRLRDAGGRAVYGVLDPAPLAEKVGLPLLVALPSTGVLVAWPGGDPQLDKVMAVGVREMHDAASDPVSAVVFGWDGARWFAFAEATHEPPEQGAQR